MPVGDEITPDFFARVREDAVAARNEAGIADEDAANFYRNFIERRVSEGVVVIERRPVQPTTGSLDISAARAMIETVYSLVPPHLRR